MKNTQIIMLVLVCLVCGVCGYLLAGAVLGDKPARNTETEEAAVEEVVFSTVPVIESVSTPALVSGKYNFRVNASVESGDTLVYVVCKDAAGNDVVATQRTSDFAGLPPVKSQTYYVLVQNTRTYEVSDVVAVEGFLPPVVTYRKVTAAELNELFNGYKEWTNAPQHVVAMNNGVRLHFTGLDDSRESRPAKSLSDVANKCKTDTWASANVTSVKHDPERGRLTDVSITVTYPAE